MVDLRAYFMMKEGGICLVLLAKEVSSYLQFHLQTYKKYGRDLYNCLPQIEFNEAR